MNPKCRICKTPTETGFNINFDLVPICENCAAAIFLQQANWYVRERNKTQDALDKEMEKFISKGI